MHDRTMRRPALANYSRVTAAFGTFIRKAYFDADQWIGINGFE
jgi:hypothetical protein